MRAIFFDGKPAYRTDLPAPSPAIGEALIRVSYAGICATDLEILKGYMGFRGVPGHEFVGVVEGCADRGLLGKRVVGEINLWCGSCEYCRRGLRSHCPNRTVLGIYGKDGAFAEYITLPVRNLHDVPDSVSDEEAVFVEPLAAAFEILEQVRVDKDKKVCVIGDGRLGLLAAQVLSLTGCSLTAVGRHGEKLSILEGAGIETRVGSVGLKREYDVAVDCTGSISGLDEALKLVRPRSTVVLKTTTAQKRGLDLNALVIDEIAVLGSRCGPFKPAIEALSKKTVKTAPLISGVFPIEQGVKAMERASEKGVIKVLIRV